MQSLWAPIRKFTTKLHIVYKRETISLHLNRELDSAAACLNSVCLYQQYYVEDRWLDVTVLKKND